MNKINSTTLVSSIAIIVTIIIAVINYYNVEKYKDELKISKAIEIHTDLKYKIEKYLNISQDIMQDKISVIYIHNNIIKAINVTKNIQYEMQYKISSFPKYASVDISKMKEAITNKIQSINDKLNKMKNLKSNIEKTFKKLELYETNPNINKIELPYNRLFKELVETMEFAYKKSLNIQKNIFTISNVLIISNDNKEISNKFMLPLEDDQNFYELLKKHSTNIRDNLDLIDPRLL